MLKMKTTTPNILSHFPTTSEMHIEDDEIVVSSEVTSLYTNFPVTDALNLIEDYVNNDDPSISKTVILQDKFLDLQSFK